MRLRNGLIAPLLLVSAGCVARPPSGAVPPSGTAPSQIHSSTCTNCPLVWVSTNLYFGLGPADHPEQGISEADWRAFLDREVTQRFPSGLSVVDVYGQWQGKGEHSVERLRSKMLVVLHPDTQENRDKIEAIRTAWKQRTGNESVLRVTAPADVSF